MPFRDNIDFCCLVLDGPVLSVQGTQNIAPELSVSSSSDHIDLDFWEEWLGTIQTQILRRSSFVITAERYSLHDAGANYRARERIERRVRLFHFALMLEGCGFNSTSFMIGGNTAGAIYSRIFSHDALREQLRTESRVEGFWRRTEANRQALWGQQFNLDILTREHFHATEPNDLL